jgi:hypothetical protein
MNRTLLTFDSVGNVLPSIDLDVVLSEFTKASSKDRNATMIECTKHHDSHSDLTSTKKQEGESSAIEQMKLVKTDCENTADKKRIMAETFIENHSVFTEIQYEISKLRLAPTPGELAEYTIPTGNVICDDTRASTMTGGDEPYFKYGGTIAARTDGLNDTAENCMYDCTGDPNCRAYEFKKLNGENSCRLYSVPVCTHVDYDYGYVGGNKLGPTRPRPDWAYPD